MLLFNSGFGFMKFESQSNEKKVFWQLMNFHRLVRFVLKLLLKICPGVFNIITLMHFLCFLTLRVVLKWQRDEFRKNLGRYFESIFKLYFLLAIFCIVFFLVAKEVHSTCIFVKPMWYCCRKSHSYSGWWSTLVIMAGSEESVSKF